MKKTMLAALLFLISTMAFADVRLPAVLGSHMVLQQNTDAALWGWCEPGETIQVNVSWDTTTYKVRGTANADWRITVKTPKAGGPYTISIKANNSITLEDVMIGEVWVCSGQSNMEWSAGWGLPYDKETSEATNQKIRFFHIPRTTSLTPQDDVKAKWVVCSPEEMKRFSAVGYFFGKGITDKLALPVGLIGSSWGGTPAEVWTQDSVVKANTTLSQAAAELKPSGGWPIRPGATYNAMIYPLVNYPIAGAIWYQGESNVGTWRSYSQLLTSMIDSWRKGWNKEFPFYLVQIAPFSGYGSDQNNGALLREQQTKAAVHSNTGMVVIHDLVDNVKDIHPKLKKEVGQRLADYALTHTYGVTDLPKEYPQYSRFAVEKDKVRVQFSNVDGLVANGGELTDFYIAGEDKVFVPAKAKIDGASVVVWSKEVKKPAAVRFGFTNDAMPKLYTKQGLPVGIFRTDDWDVNTIPVKK